jgi:hypothetical protein
VHGTEFTDHLIGTSAHDFVLAGAGNDRIDSTGGHDVVNAQEGDDSISAGPGDDWIAAGAGTDVMRGGLGRDLYLYARGDGADIVEEQGAAGEVDSILFAGDIAASEVSVARTGGDLVLALGTSTESITVRDWFAADTMRVERVAFNDGTVWDAAALAGFAGETLPAPAPVEPELPAEPAVSVPPLPPVVTVPPGDPSTGDPLTPEPASPPPAGIPGSETPAASAPAGAPSAVPFILPAAASAASSTPMAEASPGEPGAPAPSVPSTAESSGASSAVAGTPATLETLAAAGFVSPGRPAAGSTELATETIAPETVSPEETTPAETAFGGEPPSAMAAYWRWMHARLEAHLDETEVEDLGAPPLYDYRPLAQSFSEGLPALVPARTVGIRDRAAFEARTFDGLRDGFARLG